MTDITTRRFQHALGGRGRDSLAQHLRTSEAAQLLGVAPNTLRLWHERFRFPTTQRAASGNRLFLFSEVIALRNALEADHSITAAITLARASLAEIGSPGVRLAGSPRAA